jgi:predicted ribosomally synthesized peptide with SipW-like signal peptide
MENNTVIVNQKKSPRRKIAAIIGAGTLGLALLGGVTFASFTDSEYGWFHGDSKDGGLQAAVWNLQIKNSNETTWHDTVQFGAYTANPAPGTGQDNTIDDIEDPIELNYTGGDFVPGDTTTDVKGTVDIRLAVPADLSGNIIHGSTLKVYITDNTTTGGRTGSDKSVQSDPTLLADLRVDIWDNGTASGTPAVQGSTIADLTANGVALTDIAAPNSPAGDTRQISYRIYLPDTTPNPGLIQGAQVFLEFRADGASI